MWEACAWDQIHCWPSMWGNSQWPVKRVGKVEGASLSTYTLLSNKRMARSSNMNGYISKRCAGGALLLNPANVSFSWIVMKSLMNFLVLIGPLCTKEVAGFSAASCTYLVYDQEEEWINICQHLAICAFCPSKYLKNAWTVHSGRWWIAWSKGALWTYTPVNDMGLTLGKQWIYISKTCSGLEVCETILAL